jgi:hypothetical protein
VSKSKSGQIVLAKHDLLDGDAAIKLWNSIVAGRAKPKMDRNILSFLTRNLQLTAVRVAGEATHLYHASEIEARAKEYVANAQQFGVEAAESAADAANVRAARADQERRKRWADRPDDFNNPYSYSYTATDGDASNFVKRVSQYDLPGDETSPGSEAAAGESEVRSSKLTEAIPGGNGASRRLPKWNTANGSDTSESDRKSNIEMQGGSLTVKTDVATVYEFLKLYHGPQADPEALARWTPPELPDGTLEKYQQKTELSFRKAQNHARIQCEKMEGKSK